MTPRFIGRHPHNPPAPRVRRGPSLLRPGIERLEDRLAPAGLPPELIVGRTLSAYSVANVSDRSLTVTYTVYNQRAEEVSGVLLTTTLQPGVTFATATQLPDRNDQELAWSLGTVPAFGRASVAVTVTLPDPLPLVIDDGATVFGTLYAGTVSADTPAATLTTRALPPDLLAATPDANTADPFVQEQAARLRYDPQAIFHYLNDQVGYESYLGSLRGSRGTLWSAAGNSLDEASLGVALFRASGIPARYAHGSLSDALSKQLILSMFPADTQTVGSIPPGTPTADPANDPQLLNEARDHYWLQIDTGGGFQNADSSGLPGGGVGTAFTTVTDTFTEVPDALRHKVRVSLDAELYSQASAFLAFGNGLGTRTVLDRTFNAVDLVGRPLTLAHNVNRSTAGFLIVATTTTYEPYLVIGDVARPDLKTDDVIHGQQYQETATNFPLGTQVLTGLFLKVGLSGPQHATETFDRALVDRIGFASRSGFTAGSVTSDPDAPPALNSIDAFTLDVAVGQNDPRYPGQYPAVLATLNEQLTRINAGGPTQAPEAGAAFTVAMATATRVIGSSFRTTSDVATNRLAADARVTAYADRPRVVMVSHKQTLSADGETSTHKFAIDLLVDTIRGLAAPGQANAAARGFQVLYGVSQTYREQTVLTSFIPSDPGLTQTIGDYAVVLAAIEQGVPLTVLTAASLTTLDSLSLADEAKARITAAVGRGKTVIVPVRPVLIGGTSTTAWYEVDTTTGQTIGTTTDGGHTLSEQLYLILVEETGSVFNAQAVIFLGIFLVAAIGAILFVHSLPPYLEDVQSSLDPVGTSQAAGLPTTASPLIDRLQSIIGSPLPGSPVTTQLLDPLPDPAFPPNEATADIPITAGLTAGPVTADIQTPGVRLSGRLSTTWAASGDQSFQVSGLTAAETTVRSADGTLVGSGSVELTDAGGSPLTATGNANYSVTGTGTLAGYHPATGGLGAAADWTAYTATLTGSTTLRVTTAGLRLNGAVLPAGTYTVSTTAATLTGSGPGSAPRLTGPITVQATDALIHLGSGIGTASIGGAALSPGGGVTLTRFTGTVTVAPGGSAVRATVAGTAAGAVSLTAPTVVSADQNEPASFQLGVQTTRTDSYHTNIEAPPGWTVTVNAAGRVTLAPPPGTQAGSYPIVLRSTLLADLDFATRTLVTVTVTPTAPNVTLDVQADPSFPVSFNGAAIPTGFRVVLDNLGPAAVHFDLTVSGLPPGFTVALSKSDLTVPAGETGIRGLYLQPIAGTALPAPGTVLNFTVTATSTTDPSLTRTQSVTFTMPVVHAVTATITPATVGATPGETASATLTMTAAGNVAETVTLSVISDADLTVGGLPETTNLSIGQTVTTPLTLGVLSSVPLNTTLAASIRVANGPVVNQIPVSVRVAVPGADAIITASDAAKKLGNTALAARLDDLSVALTNLVLSPSNPIYQSQALAALDVVATLVAADPYLATTLPELSAGRNQLDAATTEVEVRAATVALGDAIGDIGSTLAAVLAHRFELSLLENTAVARPLVPVSYGVLLRNTGTETTTYDLAVTGLPTGVTGVFSQDSVILAPGQSTYTVGNPDLTLTLTPGAGEIAAFGFTVRATARPAAAITRTVSGSLAARQELVSIVAVTPAPAFTDPGGQVAVSARILNAVNREQTATVRYTVTDAGGTVRFTSSPITTTLGVLTSLSTVDLGTLNTTGFAIGDYTLTVTVSDAAGQPIAGATGIGRLLVGSPVTASLRVGPEALPAGTGTVSATLQLDARAAAGDELLDPIGTLAIPGAGPVQVRGNRAYVAATNGIAVVDISNPTSPQLITTFGAADIPAGLVVGGLRLVGDRLVAMVNKFDPSANARLLVYSLADPSAPTLLGQTPLTVDGVNFTGLGPINVIDERVYSSAFWFRYFISGQQVFGQWGESLVIDVSNPTSPAVVDVIYNRPPEPTRTYPDGTRWPDGSSNFWQAARVNSTTALIGTTANTANVVNGVGQVLVVDTTNPNDPNVVRTLDVPGISVVTGIQVTGTTAWVIGSSLGWRSGIAPLGLNGKVVVARLDLSSPQNPTIAYTKTFDTDAIGIHFLDDLGGGLLVTTSVSGPSFSPQLLVLDTNDPNDVRLITVGVTAPIGATSFDAAGGFLLTGDGTNLTVYQVGQQQTTPTTARITVPTTDGVAVVPGSFNLAPTRTQPVAGGVTYEWDLAVPQAGGGTTITWQQTVSDIVPGRTRTVTTAGAVSFLSQGTQGTVALADAIVTGAQIVGLTPATRTVAPGGTATYTVRLTNPSAAPVTYTLTVPGVPAGWVNLPPTVAVPANGSVDIPLFLTADRFAVLDDYGFTIVVSGSNGAASAVSGELVLQGVPTPIDATARGVVIHLTPVQASAGQGATAVFVARVTNTGSETATFSLFANGLPDAVTATFAQPTVTVPPGVSNFRDVMLTLTPIVGTPVGDMPFTVSAVAEPTIGETAGILTVTAGGVQVELDRTTATPGDPFQMTVTNTGTTSDTFALTAAGPGSLVATLGETQLTLAPGESRTVPVATSPANFAIMGELSLMVAASSTTDPAVRDSASAGLAIAPTNGLTARLEPAATTLPNPGVADIVFVVSNTGNAADEYTVTLGAVNGPLTATLLDVDGVPTQTIAKLRLPGLSSGTVLVRTTLTAAGLGTVAVAVRSLTDGRTVTSTAAVQTPGVVPPVTPPPPPVTNGHRPQPAQVSGRADGAAFTLTPTGGVYSLGSAVVFFPDFAGDVRVATADVTGDGVADQIGGAGPGGGPRVAVIDGATGQRLADFYAFETSFTGGVFVAAGDLDGDGRAEVIVTPDQGGGPVVVAYRATGLTAGHNEASQMVRFFGIEDRDFRGGARAAAGDVDSDGRADLLVSAGFPGGPRISLYRGADVASGSDAPARLVPDFFAFEDTFRNGAYVATGDIDGDGAADLAFGGGPGGGPRVRLINGRLLLAAGEFHSLDEVFAREGLQLADFFAGDPDRRGGVRVALRDADGDGIAELITGSGDGEAGRVQMFKTVTARAAGSADLELEPFADTKLPHGTFVG